MDYRDNPNPQQRGVNIARLYGVNFRRRLTGVLRERPAVAQALFWPTSVDEAVLREWVVNLGQRDALERIAHVLYEM